MRRSERHSISTRRRTICGKSLKTSELSIKELDEYQDEELLRQVWKMSPYNTNSVDDTTTTTTRHTASSRRKSFTCSSDSTSTTSNDDSSHSSTARNSLVDKIQATIISQPQMGHCGLATINTALRSLVSRPTSITATTATSFSSKRRSGVPIPFHKMEPMAFTMQELGVLLQEIDPRGEFYHVEWIYMSPQTTLQQFRRIVQESNSPYVRLLANFHRTPLFDGYGWGHWSPVGGYLRREVNDDEEVDEDDDDNEDSESEGEEDDDEANQYRNELVLILDTNESYGPYLVPLQRFFQAVQTRDSSSSDGRYRGFIQIHLYEIR